MQVTSAKVFSIVPAQNTEVTEGANNANTIVNSECDCATGESLFNKLLFRAIAKEDSTKTQDVIPEITSATEASKDTEAGICDISAVIAQLFVSPNILPDNGRLEASQNADTLALSNAETENAALPQMEELNTIINSQTANTSEASSILPKAELTKENLDFRLFLNADDNEFGSYADDAKNISQEAIKPAGGTNPEVIKTISETTSGVATPTGVSPPEFGVTQNVGTVQNQEKPTAVKASKNVMASDSNLSTEKTTGGDITDFVGKIKEAVKTMGGKEAESGTSEGFTADKKETASLKDGESAVPIHITPLKTEPQEIDKSASVEKALSKLTEDLKSVEHGVSEIKIVLEPESLGKLTISVSRTENGITARIKSDDKEICGIISGQIQKLVAAMEESGIKIKDVDVLFGGSTGQDLSFTQNSSGGNQNWNNQHSRYTAQTREKADAADSTVQFSKWRDYQSADDGVSSLIEYRI